MYDVLTVYLENGMQVVMHKVSHSRTMACGVFIKQGSMHEKPSQSGLSHLIEHLMINIEDDSRPNFQKSMKNIANRGVVYNATTTKEYTTYYMSGLQTCLEESIEALSHMLIENPISNLEILEKEKSVVKQEATSFYSSFSQIKERTNQALWGNIGIGMPIIGDLDIIKSANLETLKEIYEKVYVPENSVLVIVGGIDYTQTLKIVENCFCQWKDRTTETGEINYEDSPGIYVNQCKESSSSVISLGYRLNALTSHTKTHLDIISKVIGDASFESRLMKEIRMKNSLAYSVGSFKSYYNDIGTIGFMAVCSNENVGLVSKLMKNVINDVVCNGLTLEEISRAKHVIQTAKVMGIDNVTDQLNYLGRSAINGHLFSLEKEIRQIERINPERIADTINESFRLNQMGFAGIGNFDIDEIVVNFE